MEMVNKATGAIDDLKRKICDSSERSREGMKEVKHELDEFKKEVAKSLNCRECPARAQLGR
jgi:uncharacterized protein Yka (UPF0111/DUF47 family)